LKLGVNILNFGQGTSPDSLRGWARFAEEAGFAIATISDHVVLTRTCGPSTRHRLIEYG
jgi:hypothetical protein